jgi:hypothetical protein
VSASVFRILSAILLGVMALTLGLALAISLSIPARVSQAEINIACAGRQSDIDTLKALHHIADTLGLPPDTVVVPTMPEECE